MLLRDVMVFSIYSKETFNSLFRARGLQNQYSRNKKPHRSFICHFYSQAIRGLGHNLWFYVKACLLARFLPSFNHVVLGA